MYSGYNFLPRMVCGLGFVLRKLILSLQKQFPAKNPATITYHQNELTRTLMAHINVRAENLVCFIDIHVV